MANIEEFYESFEPLRDQIELGATALKLGQEALEQAGTKVTPFVTLGSGRRVAVGRRDAPRGSFITLVVDVASEGKPAIPKEYAYVEEGADHPKIAYDLGLISGPLFKRDKDEEVVAAMQVLHDASASWDHQPQAVV